MTLTVDATVALPGAATDVRSMRVAASPRATPAWQQRYAATLLGLDALAMLVGGQAALLWRFGDTDAALRGLSYHLLVVALVPV